MSHDYDNAYNGAVFPTTVPGLMAGPFELPDGQAARATLERNALGEGVHALRVYRKRKDGTPGKQLFEGPVQRYRSRHPQAPIAVGYLTNGRDRIEVCLWLCATAVDRYYQIKPDALRAEQAEAFAI